MLHWSAVLSCTSLGKSCTTCATQPACCCALLHSTGQPGSELAANPASCQPLARWSGLQVSEPDSNLAASLLRSRPLGAHSAALRASAATGSRRAVRAASSMVQTQTASLRPVVKVCWVTGVLAVTGPLAACLEAPAAWCSAQATQAARAAWAAGAGSRCWQQVPAGISQPAADACSNPVCSHASTAAA